MSEIIDLTKNSSGNCNLKQNAIFANIFVRTVLPDLLHTSCQYLYPIDNIVTSNNLNTDMCTLHDFFSGKVRFIYTSTVTRSILVTEKITRTARLHLVKIGSH